MNIPGRIVHRPLRIVVAATAVAAGLVTAVGSPAWAAGTGFTYTQTANVSVGGFPAGVGVDSGTHTSYSANGKDNTVSVVDDTTNTLTATIGVGAHPLAVAVDPDTDTIYVGNDDDHSVSVINGATNAVTATVAVGAGPRALAVDPATDTVYVANSQDNSVSVIDGATNNVTATITGVTSPFGVAVDPATDTVYATNLIVGSGTVMVISGATDTVTATIGVGDFPSGIAIDSATHTAYVVNGGAQTVSVIDEAAGTVTATVSVPNNPESVAVDASADTVYVGGENPNANVDVLDGSTNTVTATVPVGDGGSGLGDGNSVAVDPATHAAYADSGFVEGHLSVISRGTTATTTTVATTGPVAAGAAVTLTATVSPAPDAGTVGFTVNGDPVATCTAQPVDSSSGVASCTLTAPTTAGSYLVTATYTGADGFISSSDSASLQVNAGPLASLALSPSTASITAGGSQAYTATGSDQYGNSLGDVTAQTTFAVSPDGTCTKATCTATAAGPHTVTGTDGTATGTAALTVTAGSAATMTIRSGNNQSAATGQAFSTPLSLTVTDASSNPVPGATVTFTIVQGTGGTANFGGSTQSATATTSASGVATAPTLDAGTTTGPVAVTATSGTAETTFMETVTTAGPARADLAVSMSAPTTLRPGGTGTIIVTVTDKGPGAASKVGTLLSVPDGLTITSAGGGTVRGRVDVFTAPSLSAGGKLTYTITVKAGSARTRVLLATGTGSATRDPNLFNNIALAFLSIT